VTISRKEAFGDVCCWLDSVSLISHYPPKWRCLPDTVNPTSEKIGAPLPNGIEHGSKCDREQGAELEEIPPETPGHRFVLFTRRHIRNAAYRYGQAFVCSCVNLKSKSDKE
jgi:hypothetical protein